MDLLDKVYSWISPPARGIPFSDSALPPKTISCLPRKRVEQHLPSHPSSGIHLSLRLELIYKVTRLERRKMPLFTLHVRCTRGERRIARFKYPFLNYHWQDPRIKIQDRLKHPNEGQSAIGINSSTEPTRHIHIQIHQHIHSIRIGFRNLEITTCAG